MRPLGADCPFFIYNTPCFAEGIGDLLTPIDFSLKGYRILMIKPACGVSTREAYSGLHLSAEKHNQFSNSQICKFTNLQIANDFEQSVFPLHPEIAHIKKRLLDAGALYASMSGSGSTVFGLFEHDAEGGTRSDLRLLHEEFASMILLDDTL